MNAPEVLPAPRADLSQLSSQGDARDYRAIGLTHLAVRELRRRLLACAR